MTIMTFTLLNILTRIRCDAYTLLSTKVNIEDKKPYVNPEVT
jgi:hypothetical protein